MASFLKLEPQNKLALQFHFWNLGDEEVDLGEGGVFELEPFGGDVLEGRVVQDDHIICMLLQPGQRQQGVVPGALVSIFARMKVLAGHDFGEVDEMSICYSFK